jgi:drug/metabolite transporter (DMT)-like permease
LRRRWRPIALIGITQSALPLLAFSLAALRIPAGLSSILNATRPIFGALTAMTWLREPISASRIVGLCIGFVGVVLPEWQLNGLAAGGTGAGAVVHWRRLRPVVNLIARIEPACAILITLLLPAFAMLWPGVFLGETVTPLIMPLCAPTLLATSLIAGAIKLPQRTRQCDGTKSRPERR